MLGPNGAGKTTLLRILAGLLSPDEGRVVLDGRVLDDTSTGEHVPPEARPVGVVFQNYLLFPHLSALENVAFGLRSRGVPKAEARARAAEWLDRVGLAEFRASKPKQLSGGQAQRVALARALATEPRLLLLDEPLAALDASTRLETRRELRRQLDGYDGVRLLVTHDPMEAIALAERLIVLEAGRISQTGTPQEISERPRSRYVADLVGVNLFRGRAAGRRGPHRLGRSAGGAGRRSGRGVRRRPSPRRRRSTGSRRRARPATCGRARPRRSTSKGSGSGCGSAGRCRSSPRSPRGPWPICGSGDGGPVWVSVKATEVVGVPGVAFRALRCRREGPGCRSPSGWCWPCFRKRRRTVSPWLARCPGRRPSGEVWTVPRPLVYRALGRLEEQGLIVEAGEEPGDPGPRRMVYEATGKGRKAVAQWRAEPVRHLRDVRSAFLAKVLLRQRAGEPLGPLVAEQRAVFAPLFERLTEQFEDRETDHVIASWRYESSQAVARLLDHLEDARPGS